jgi:single-strand DNA-binding protein
VNSVSIIGRLTRDPELRTLPSGQNVCSLRLAVDRAGPKTDEGIGAGFFDVTLWGKTAEVAADNLAKGRQVGIVGELRWREWEQDGVKRQSVEINGSRMTFVGSRDSEGSGGGGFDPDDDGIPF